MWYLVYRDSDGQAVSLGTEIADPLPEGLKAYELGEDLPERIDWDPATRAWALPVVEEPPAPPANHRRRQ